MLKRKFLNSCGLINAAVSDQDILSQINKLIIPKIKKPQTRIEKNEYLAIRVRPSIKQTSHVLIAYNKIVANPIHTFYFLWFCYIF